MTRAAYVAAYSQGMTEFTLRPMEPTDGPAIDALMRSEAQTTAVSLSTHYLVDVYEALLAQHPTMFGVVATAPGFEGLVGIATAFIEPVQVGGQTLPAARLQNLKVHHDVRRQGLGARLARWRIDEAGRRFGGDGVFTTDIDATNAASIATARHWATEILGPMRIRIGRTATKRPREAAFEVRPMASGDVEAVVGALNAFYQGATLYSPQTVASLEAMLGPTSLGMPIRQYRVAVDGAGRIVAGTAVTERFRLTTDHLEGIPRPLELLSRVVPLIPPDRVIRNLELDLAWHAPDRVDAARALWDGIRFEWRDRATNVSCVVDARGTLVGAFESGGFLIPKIQLVVPIRSPVPVDRDQLVYTWR